MMARVLSPKDRMLLGSLRQRTLLILDFVERTQEFPSGPRVREVTEKAYSTGDLRAMRMIARDVDAMTVGMAQDQRDGLDALLKSRVGIDRESEREEQQKRVATILRRGTIASEKERRRLEEYADGLEATGDDPDEALAIRRLLAGG